MNGRLVQAESLGGYLETKPGNFHAYYLVVNGATPQNTGELLKVFHELNDISAILQEDASNQGKDSQGGQ